MTNNWEADVDMLQCQIQDLQIEIQRYHTDVLNRLSQLEAKLCELRSKKAQSLDGIVQAALFGTTIVIE
jgi:hypothetical protein